MGGGGGLCLKRGVLWVVRVRGGGGLAQGLGI